MHNFRVIFSIVFLLFVAKQVVFGQEVPLNNQEAEELREKVLEKASQIQTIRSDFTQKKHLDFLSNDIESLGKMVFKSPDLVRWEYTKPFQYSVVFKGDQLLINDEGNKNRIDLASNELFRSLNDLIAKSIKGDLFDEGEFEIEYFTAKDHYLVNFHPRKEPLNSYIKTFQLTFNKEDGDVAAVKMIEPSNDYTFILFENRVLNEVVDPKVFSNEY